MQPTPACDSVYISHEGDCLATPGCSLIDGCCCSLHRLSLSLSPSWSYFEAISCTCWFFFMRTPLSPFHVLGCGWYLMCVAGEIPPSLGNLVNLTRLYLRDNKLTGEGKNGMIEAAVYQRASSCVTPAGFDSIHQPILKLAIPHQEILSQCFFL